MLKTFYRAGLGAVVALALVFSSLQPAEAGRGGRFAAGVAAGIIGLGILGAHARADDDYDYDDGPGECHPGPERCGWVNRRCFENEYGDEVCRGGRYTCWRPDVCD